MLLWACFSKKYRTYLVKLHTGIFIVIFNVLLIAYGKGVLTGYLHHIHPAQKSPLESIFLKLVMMSAVVYCKGMVHACGYRNTSQLYHLYDIIVLMMMSNVKSGLGEMTGEMKAAKVTTVLDVL